MCIDLLQIYVTFELRDIFKGLLTSNCAIENAFKYIIIMLVSLFRYALFVLDNHNLQDIWDLQTHPKLKIEKGKVFFHFNPKLCLNKIDDFVQYVGLENVTDNTDISRDTNGDQAACKYSSKDLV